MLDKVYPAAGHLLRPPIYGATAATDGAGLETAAIPAFRKTHRRANCHDTRPVNTEEFKVTPSPAESAADRPTIALAMGDPAGVSPELTARLLADEEIRQSARIVVFGDRRILDGGAKVAGVALDIDVVGPTTPLQPVARPVLVDLGHLAPSAVQLGVATPEGGAFAIENFRRALAMAQAGEADAVCFTPFNKQAMRYVYAKYDDEIRFVSDVIGFHGTAREFNILEGLWNARVTSHIPLADVAKTITTELVNPTSTATKPATVATMEKSRTTCFICMRRA